MEPFVVFIFFIIFLSIVGFIFLFIANNQIKQTTSSQPASQQQPSSQQQQSSSQQPPSSQQQQSSSQQQPPSSQQQQPPTNVCDNSTKSQLNGYSCKQLADMGIPPNSLAIIFGSNNNRQRNALGAQYNNIGIKYPGEDCWYEPIGNCISPTCIKDNTVGVDKGLFECALRYKADRGGTLLEPSFAKLMEFKGVETN